MAEFNLKNGYFELNKKSQVPLLTLTLVVLIQQPH